MKKNLIYIVLLVILGVLAFSPKVRDFLFPVAEIKSAITVEESDYDVQLKGINTADANLKDFRGKKLLFLNFWGTWCAPCREEWPSIQKLYNDKKNDVDFVLIAMMDKEDEVRQFLEKNQYTVPVYIAESPINSKILPKAFPTTFLLDKNGRILLKEEATRDWNSASAKEFIDNVK